MIFHVPFGHRELACTPIIRRGVLGGSQRWRELTREPVVSHSVSQSLAVSSDEGGRAAGLSLLDFVPLMYTSWARSFNLVVRVQECLLFLVAATRGVGCCGRVHRRWVGCTARGLLFALSVGRAGTGSRAKAEGFKECLGRIHLFLHLRRVAVVQLPLLVPRKADALAICSRAALGPQTSRDASLPVGILELSLL